MCPYQTQVRQLGQIHNDNNTLFPDHLKIIENKIDQWCLWPKGNSETPPINQLTDLAYLFLVTYSTILSY